MSSKTLLNYCQPRNRCCGRYVMVKKPDGGKPDISMPANSDKNKIIKVGKNLFLKKAALFTLDLRSNWICAARFSKGSKTLCKTLKLEMGLQLHGEPPWAPSSFVHVGLFRAIWVTWPVRSVWLLHELFCRACVSLFRRILRSPCIRGAQRLDKGQYTLSFYLQSVFNTLMCFSVIIVI